MTGNATLSGLLLGLGLAVFPACDVEVEPGFDYGFEQVEPETVLEPDANEPYSLVAPSAELEHPAAGWLGLDDAAVDPWCSAVLVAPDVMMTATACVEGLGTSRLTAGFGIPGLGRERPVAQVVVLEADPHLAAVVLTAPVEDVEPAAVRRLEDDACDVESVSYRYAIKGDVGGRWTWTACYEAANAGIEPVDGEPNCHGDNGAPAFSADGDLIGIVYAAVAGDLCVARLTLATPTDGDDAFDEAMALSSM